MAEPIDLTRFDAVLFDLDGVLTATAKVHAACWKRLFDDELRRRADATGGPFVPFTIADDYRRYVDGKPRYDGVRSFLASRGIELPDGDPSDPPEAETVCGLGNRKDALLHRVLAEEGVEVYEGSIAWVRRLHDAGLQTAVVTSSRNGALIMEAAGIDALFDVRVDGLVAAEEGLAGKPEPDTFLRAAERLGAAPARSIVVEDAISGVEAGRRGDFGLVIGVDRTGDAEGLRAHGADLVVEDLSELLPDPAR
jgi:beta-phosphoglucomutase family hydrolase